MGRLPKIILTLISVLLFSGCLERIDKGDSQDKGKIIAQVGETPLYDNMIKIIYPAGISAADSLQMLEAYVNSWVRRQIKLQEAEMILADEGIDIDEKVEDYRRSLLTRNMEQHYVANKLDTVIIQSEIDDYYKTHTADFILDRAIVKGRIVRVPNTFRQQAQLKTLMGNTGTEKQKDFLDMCTKNNLELLPFEDWTDFRVFLGNVPTKSGQNYEKMLPDRKIQELSDADNKYYIQITASKKKGEQAPQEWVEDIIKRIILTARSNEIIKSIDDSLYNAAMNQRNRVIININK